ncbi:MAG: hypothetical protein ACJ8AT_27640 [Hyalangium sp.]|uniref:hypothetical protein n=1 Tax=Hyalangium sp. TaxID=2028555 RepID=UPI003899DB1E
MKISNQKFLVAGLLAGALTFVGCKSDKSAERPPDTTQTTPPAGTGTDTTGTGTGTSTGTQTNPGTGGSGNSDGQISTTKQSDDNLRMPEDDPLRLKNGDKSIRDAESEQGVHENTPATPKLEPNSGTGGSGLNNDATDDNLNDGGNVDDSLRIPDSPADRSTPDGVTNNNAPVPDDATAH